VNPTSLFWAAAVHLFFFPPVDLSYIFSLFSFYPSAGPALLLRPRGPSLYRFVPLTPSLHVPPYLWFSALSFSPPVRCVRLVLSFVQHHFSFVSTMTPVFETPGFGCLSDCRCRGRLRILFSFPPRPPPDHKLFPPPSPYGTPCPFFSVNTPQFLISLVFFPVS